MLVQGAEHLMFLFLLRNVLGSNCPSLSLLTATKTPQNITSPNYPLAYPRTSSCTWVVQSNLDDGIIKFKINSFSLDASANCYADYLEIKDGTYRLGTKIIRWCGKKSASKIYRTTQNGAHFTFQAVSFGNDASGFSLQYWTIEKDRFRTAERVLTVAHYILAGVAALILVSFAVTLMTIWCIRESRFFERKNIIHIFYSLQSHTEKIDK